MTTTATASRAHDEASSGGVGVNITDLWKVYGANPQREREVARTGQLRKHDNGTVAVRNVSFDVRPGETFVVMGLSGSGKSTLVRCLTRLVEPTAGSVRIGGVDVRAMSRRQLCDARGRDWAMVFQHFGLLPHRRVLQNVAYGLEIGGVPRSEREDRAREMIDLVGLNGVEDKHPHELSGGMKQRVGLARALAVRPKLLLLDEPFSALDPLIRTDLQDQLLRIAQLGGQTSIFITHDLSEALKVGDRIAIMRNGELVQVGTPEDIVLRPKDDYVRRFALEAPRAKVVTAKTAARKPAHLEGWETVDQALTMVRTAGATAAVVQQPVPFVVTETQLALADRRVGLDELRNGDVELVSEHTKLWDVMGALTRTKNPVIVQNARGELVGTVDSSAVIEALGVPSEPA